MQSIEDYVDCEPTVLEVDGPGAGGHGEAHAPNDLERSIIPVEVVNAYLRHYETTLREYPDFEISLPNKVRFSILAHQDNPELQIRRQSTASFPDEGAVFLLDKKSSVSGVGRNELTTRSGKKSGTRHSHHRVCRSTEILSSPLRALQPTNRSQGPVERKSNWRIVKGTTSHCLKLGRGMRKNGRRNR